ncbi:diacylglycerol O-acyltransferase 1 [Ctenocephalides felis]|uniref:diacylglycerol O-acyltransferase 1 n=1 Tax=Ctenocephalides felis TaxID=7515 RepID=UPI000E6E4F28|nr:diacylglycerol O-acyltransferase 1 [Ctenocephalides felis]
MTSSESVSSEENVVRYRRAQSTTRAEEITKNEQKVRWAQPDKPCHRPRDSLFSWTSGFRNFQGLVNWGFLLLSIGGLRLALENVIKYGIRIDPIQWFNVLTGRNEGGADHPSIVLVLYSVVPVVICLLCEKALSVEIINNGTGMFIHVSNIFALVVLPVIVLSIKGNSFSLFGGTTVCFVYAILFLKLWSYVHVNLWCRKNLKRPRQEKNRQRRQSLSVSFNEGEKNGSAKSLEKDPKGIVKYPDNLSLKDLYYFLVAPTLCYELNFPRTSRIRKRFLLKRLLEVVVGIHVVMSLFQQWMIPSVKNSLTPFSTMDITKITERLLKLAIPNHLMWLCFFYLTFHSFLNLIGELLHFADRNFYADWWNANNIDTFWRTWNMPVHKWCVRHLYIPIVEFGCGKFTAGIVVFLISALLHEYLVSVPLKTFQIWAFTGMMAQIPLSFISRFMEINVGPRWGNIVVWSSIILGQPLAIMMYYHDYMITHYGDTLVNGTSH